MALPPAQIDACLRAAGVFLSKRRPPPHIREKLDYRADITGSELVIVAVRPAYDDPSVKLDLPVAKAKWVNSRKVWRLFWMRADSKWHSYQPKAQASTIAALLTEVDRDPYCCFFG